MRGSGSDAAGILAREREGFRTFDAVLGLLAFVYLFLLGRRLAGPLCGVMAVFFLAIHEELVFVHGLRSHNMEATLVLAYVAGMYHFVHWMEVRPRLLHAVAVGGWFAFGFMGKFVAALFLPLVLAVPTLVDAMWRRRMWAQRRQWALAAGLAIALIVPWFAYQTVRWGSSFWNYIFYEHVVRRFSGELVPSQIEPWHFYLARTWASVRKLWYYPVVGGLLWTARTGRHRWTPGLLVLVWFAVPFAAISCGASKLYHYAYPFLAPLALVSGYAATAAARAWESLAQRLRAGWRPAPAAERGLQVTAVAVLAAALAVLAGMVVEGRVYWQLGPIAVRSARFSRPLVVAALSVLAARRRWATVAALVLLLTVGEDVRREYSRYWERTGRTRRILSRLAGCLVEHAVRSPPGVYVYFPRLPELAYEVRHYFAPLGVRYPKQPDMRRLTRHLRRPEEYTPAIVATDEYPALRRAMGEWTVEERAAVWAVPMRQFDLYLMLPGPYAACAAVGWQRD